MALKRMTLSTKSSQSMKTRAPTSVSERELMQALTEDGCAVSLTKLSDWRKEGLLPPFASRGRGAGAGRFYFWSDRNVLAQARCVHDLLSRHGNHATAIRLLWLCGYPVPPAKARRALLKHAKRPVAWQIREAAMAEDAMDAQYGNGEGWLTGIILKLCSSFAPSQRSEMEGVYSDLQRAGEALGFLGTMASEPRHRLFTAFSLVLSAIENSSIVAASDDHDLETARQLTESAVRFIQHLDGKAEDDAIKLTRLMETLGEPVFLCVLLLQRTGYRAHLMQTHGVMASLLQRMNNGTSLNQDATAFMLRQELADIWKVPPSMQQPTLHNGAGTRSRKLAIGMGITLAIWLTQNTSLVSAAAMAGA
jgi:hypothetical protein